MALRQSKNLLPKAQKSLSSKGFAMVIFLPLLPLLLGFMLSLCLGVELIRGQNQVQKTCITQLVRIQKFQKKRIVKLLSLNPKIKRLRVRLKKQQKKLAKAVASGNGIAIITLTAKIARTTLKLNNYRTKQQLILAEIKTRTQVFLTQLTKTLNSQRFIKVLNIDNQTPAVKPNYSLSLWPIYELKKPFPEKQKLQLFWTVNAADSINRWLSGFLTQINNPLSPQTCAVTLLENFNSPTEVKLWQI